MTLPTLQVKNLNSRESFSISQPKKVLQVLTYMRDVILTTRASMLLLRISSMSSKVIQLLVSKMLRFLSLIPSQRSSSTMLITVHQVLLLCQSVDIYMLINSTMQSNTCMIIPCTKKWSCIWKLVKVVPCSRNLTTNLLMFMHSLLLTLKYHHGDLTAPHKIRLTVNPLVHALEISSPSTGWKTPTKTTRNMTRPSKLNTKLWKRRQLNHQLWNGVTLKFKKNKLELSNLPKTKPQNKRTSGNFLKALEFLLLETSSISMKSKSASKTIPPSTQETSTSTTFTTESCLMHLLKTLMLSPLLLTLEWLSTRDSLPCSQPTWMLTQRTRLRFQLITHAIEPSSIPTRIPAENSMTTPWNTCLSLLLSVRVWNLFQRTSQIAFRQSKLSACNEWNYFQNFIKSELLILMSLIFLFEKNWNFI